MPARSDKLHQRRKKVSKESLRRRKGIRQPRRRVLIVTEGSQTEPRYIGALVNHMRLTSVDVDICDEANPDPLKIVEHGFSKALGEGTPDDGGYDAVFCVFDRDEHESFERALEKARTYRKRPGNLPNLRTIFSVPCFEYWFLLHFKYSRKPHLKRAGKSEASDVVRELMKVQPFSNYQKSITPIQIETLLPRTDDAIENSVRAMADAEDTGEINPSTQVHLLVKYLKNI